MNQKQKNLEELQQEVRELKKRPDIILEKNKAPKRKPVNIVGIALFMTGAVAWNCWEFYHGRNPWHNFFELSQWDVSKRQHPLRFWSFIIEAGIAVILLMYCFFDFLARSRKQRQHIKAETQWYRDLDAAVDITDYEDQDCLYDYLEPDERKRLVHELQRMPKGSRSLHKAAQIVNPELIDDTVAY